MQMADGHRQRVGGVVRRRHAVEAEEQLHHPLHLHLLGAPVADHGAFDFRRRVFDDRKPRLDGGEHGDAARMPKEQRAPNVGRMKEVLDGDALGGAVANDPGELAMDGCQPIREAPLGAGADGAAEHELMAAAVAVHAAVAGALRSRVDAQHSHASEASISFSSMSKLDHTCCASSWSSSASISLTICDASLPCSLT